MEKAVELDARGSGMGAPRTHLHRRDLQERCEAHLRQGRLAQGPFRPLQREPGRQHEARHRIHEGDKIDEKAFKALIRAAVALNAGLARG